YYFRSLTVAFWRLNARRAIKVVGHGSKSENKNISLEVRGKGFIQRLFRGGAAIRQTSRCKCRHIAPRRILEALLNFADAARNRDLAVVLQHGNTFAAGVVLQPFDTTQIYNYRTTDSKK